MGICDFLCGETNLAMMYLVPEEVVKEKIVEVWILIERLLYIAQECTETN